MPNVVFLTGASSGLGYALAPLFAADGDAVVLAARREDRIRELAGKIQAQGGRALAVACDVGRMESVEQAVSMTRDTFGPVDILIANAGISEVMPASQFCTSLLAKIHDINVLGVARCIEAVLPSMLARQCGQIVAVSSLAGYRGLPAHSAYCSSKAAVISMLESLRVELGNCNIAVTILCPGFVRTEMTARNKNPMPFLLALDDAAWRMYRAIRRKDSEYAFPWQLAGMVRTLRHMPNCLYDRLLGRHRIEKGPPVA